MSAAPRFDGVLFDLDGTLADSAPDLVAALATLCAELGEPAPDAEAAGRVVSAGGRAILRKGLPAFDEARIEAALPRYLDLYATRAHVSTYLYGGVAELLDALDAHGIPWGIVTNKAGWLAEPVVAHLGLAERSRVLVAGDTLVQRKPDPAPVLHACAQIGVDPRRIAFVGDDRRDVEAGRAAGARTFVVGWGYLDGGDPRDWGADAIVATPALLTQALVEA